MISVDDHDALVRMHKRVHLTVHSFVWLRDWFLFALVSFVFLVSSPF